MQLYTSVTLTRPWVKTLLRKSSVLSLVFCNFPKPGLELLHQPDGAGHKDFRTLSCTVFGTNKLKFWR